MANRRFRRHCHVRSIPMPLSHLSRLLIQSPCCLSQIVASCPTAVAELPASRCEIGHRRVARTTVFGCPCADRHKRLSLDYERPGAIQSAVPLTARHDSPVIPILVQASCCFATRTAANADCPCYPLFTIKARILRQVRHAQASTNFAG